MITDSCHTATRVSLPGSKSIAARALICRLLSGHDTRIGNLPQCGDTDGMLRLIVAVREASASGAQLGVNIGEGGTTLRFGMAACASLPGLDITLTCSPRLMARPHTVLIEALMSMGAEITTLPGENAIRIKGKILTGGEIELDGSVSSQYLSALMLAAPVWEKSTLFRLKKPVVSEPYIKMTAGVMRAFGAHVAIEDKEDSLEVAVKADGYAQCAAYEVESDWSAASYFFEAILILKSISNSKFQILNSKFSGLKAPAESLQGDSRVAAIFSEAHRHLEGNAFCSGVSASREREDSAMLLNLSDAPDLVPAIAVGFCSAGIPFRIEGVAHLRHKESDRMAALQTELRRVGYVLTCGEDFMEWKGERCEAEKAPLIRTYRDHRMAMAFAPLRLLIPDLTIENPDVVEKSFPGFWIEIEKFL